MLPRRNHLRSADVERSRATSILGPQCERCYSATHRCQRRDSAYFPSVSARQRCLQAAEPRHYCSRGAVCHCFPLGAARRRCSSVLMNVVRSLFGLVAVCRPRSLAAHPRRHCCQHCHAYPKPYPHDLPPDARSSAAEAPRLSFRLSGRALWFSSASHPRSEPDSLC